MLLFNIHEWIKNPGTTNRSESWRRIREIKGACHWNSKSVNQLPNNPPFFHHCHHVILGIICEHHFIFSINIYILDLVLLCLVSVNHRSVCIFIFYPGGDYVILQLTITLRFVNERCKGRLCNSSWNAVALCSNSSNPIWASSLNLKFGFISLDLFKLLEIKNEYFGANNVFTPEGWWGLKPTSRWLHCYFGLNIACYFFMFPFFSLMFVFFFFFLFFLSFHFKLVIIGYQLNRIWGSYLLWWKLVT